MKVAKFLSLVLLVTIAGCGSSDVPKSAKGPADNYPLETCVVSGKKLGSMGEPRIIKYHDKTVKLCCSQCLPEFNTDPAKYMAILEEAEKKRK